VTDGFASAFHLPAECPRCGGPFHVVAEGKPVARTAVNTVVGCQKCGAANGQYVIEVFLRPLTESHSGSPCGTNAGAKRHRHTGERPCPICLDAETRFNNPTAIQAGPVFGVAQWESQRAERVQAIRAMTARPLRLKTSDRWSHLPPQGGDEKEWH
jgi:hypothetical protein